MSRLSVLEPAHFLSEQGVHEPSLVLLTMHLPRSLLKMKQLQLDDERRKLELEDLPENIASMGKEGRTVKDKAPDLFWGEIRTTADTKGNPKYMCVSDFALACLSLPHEIQVFLGHK